MLTFVISVGLGALVGLLGARRGWSMGRTVALALAVGLLAAIIRAAGA